MNENKLGRKFKVASLFAGIGGFDTALEQLGGEVVFASEIDKFARKSYEAIHGLAPSGDITQIASVDIPDHDLLTAGFPCFAAGTLISTSSGYKNVEDIREGDMVLTHENRYREVVTPMVKEKNGIFKLKVMGSPKTLVTEEHPFYVIEKRRVWNSGTKRYETTYSDPKWVKAEDLDKRKHLIGFSSDPIKGNPLEITPEEAFLLGRYVADGHIHDGKRSGRKNSYNNKVVFSVGIGKLEGFLSETKDYHVGYSKEGSVYKCYIINKRLTNLCKLFGRGAENKIIHGGILASNSDIRKSFLKGYWSGDGSFDGIVHKATTVSRELAYGVGRLVQNTYNIPYSIQFTKRPKTTVIEGRVVNQKDTWTVSFRKESTIRHSVMRHGLVWNPIRKIEWDDSFRGEVYNMEVEGDNSYVANNMTVHNCQAFSVAGQRAGMAFKCTSDNCGTTQTISFQQYADRDFTCESCGGLIEAVDGRGLLFFEAARVARDKQPKIVLLENVKGLVGHDKGRTLDTIVRTMSEVGYVVDFDVLNSKHYGVPQNRERIFIVAVRKDIAEATEWAADTLKGSTVVPKGKRRIAEYPDVKTFNFDFPSNSEVTTVLRDVLERFVDERYYLSEEKIEILLDKNTTEISNTLVKGTIKKGYNGITYNRKDGIKSMRDIAITLSASDWRGLNRNQDQTAVLETCSRNQCNELSILTTDQTNGGLMIREATKKGFAIAVDGDSVNFQFPGSNTRRGRVGKQVANTLEASNINQGVVEVYGNARAVLTPDRLEKRQNGRRFKEVDEEMFTLTAQDRHGVLEEVSEALPMDCEESRHNKHRIRKLTPLECFRLQGFTDEQFTLAKDAGVSDSQLYKQAGNAVTVNVIRAIGERLLPYLYNEEETE